MKIRLMGSADLIERCRQLLAQVGVFADSYPCRPPSKDLRLYADLDDRRTEELLARETTLHSAAVALGTEGGAKTAKRGPEYFRQISAARKTRRGGRAAKEKGENR